MISPAVLEEVNVPGKGKRQDQEHGNRCHGEGPTQVPQQAVLRAVHRGQNTIHLITNDDDEGEACTISVQDDGNAGKVSSSLSNKVLDQLLEGLCTRDVSAVRQDPHPCTNDEDQYDLSNCTNQQSTTSIKCIRHIEQPSSQSSIDGQEDSSLTRCVPQGRSSPVQ